MNFRCVLRRGLIRADLDARKYADLSLLDHAVAHFKK